MESEKTSKIAAANLFISKAQALLLEVFSEAKEQNNMRAIASLVACIGAVDLASSRLTKLEARSAKNPGKFVQSIMKQPIAVSTANPDSEADMIDDDGEAFDAEGNEIVIINADDADDDDIPAFAANDAATADNDALTAGLAAHAASKSAGKRKAAK